MSAVKDLFDTVEIEKRERAKRRDRSAFRVLDAARKHWDNMRAVRDDGERCHRFVNGDQWGDTIEYCGKRMTERAALIQQGYNPRTTNLLNRVVKNVMGVVLKNGNEPTAYSVDGNEQAVCDVINTLVNANNTQNKTKLLWPLQFKQFMEWAALISKMTFGYRDGKYGCWTENIDPRQFFCDTGTMDVRGWDCNMVGMIHSIALDDVLSSFATDRNPRKAKEKHHRICEIYNKCQDRKYVTGIYSEEFGKNRLRNVDFLFPKDGDLCRVIEVWTKETRPSYYVHDYLDGSLTIIGEDEYEEFVEAENQRRVMQAQMAGVNPMEIAMAMMVAGMDGVNAAPEARRTGTNAQPEAVRTELAMPDSCRLRVAEWHEDRYWYYRYMTPTGEVLDEGESPYAHKGHPFVFVFYPFVNGEIRSFVADLLEEQKNLNRNRTMYDQIMRISMKGFTAYDRNTLPEDDPDGERLTQVLAQPGSSYGFNLKQGEQIQNKVVQMSSNNTGVGLLEMIQMDTTNIEDISGVNGALQGKPGYSTTSGTLYQQQTQNATGSLLDVIEAFYSFLMDCSYKQASNILQAYDENMVRRIAGVGAWETIVQYAETMNSDTLELDFRMVENSASAVYRQIVWDYAQSWLQMGFIDFETYLKICRLPITDKLIVMLEERNAQLMEQGQQPLPSAMPQQNANASVSGVNAANAGSGQNAYNMMAATKPVM